MEFIISVIVAAVVILLILPIGLGIGKATAGFVYCTTSDLATMMNRSQRSIAGIVTQLQHINLAYVKRTSVHGEKITFVYLTNQGRDYIAGVV